LKCHFIAGLPRSGSTLLRAILGQNPKHRVNVSSPMFFLTNDLLGSMSADNGLTAQLTNDKRRDIIHGLHAGCLGALGHEDAVFFDTNRLWTSKVPLLNLLYPGAKVICCVRDVAWVLDSYERIFQKNPLEIAKMFERRNSVNVYRRVEAMMDPSTGVVRPVYDSLQEAWHRWRESLVLVRYEDLVNQPKETLARIYQAIGEPEFPHDFKNVKLDEQLYAGYDNRMGVDGLHRVRAEVKFEARKSALPPDLFARYQGMDFWND
jgi:sulfotransferase